MKELYVGIDVHLRQHVVTVIPAVKFQENKTGWEKTRSIKIGNNRYDFEYLDSTQEWANERGLERYFGSSVKGEAAINWDDEKERRAFLQAKWSDPA